jgi:hypothetical protein
LLDEVVEVVVLVESAALDFQQRGAEKEVSASVPVEQRKLRGCGSVGPEATVEAAAVAEPEGAEPTPCVESFARAAVQQVRVSVQHTARDIVNVRELDAELIAQTVNVRESACGGEEPRRMGCRVDAPPASEVRGGPGGGLVTGHGEQPLRMAEVEAVEQLQVRRLVTECQADGEFDDVAEQRLVRRVERQGRAAVQLGGDLGAQDVLAREGSGQPCADRILRCLSC